MFKTIMVIDSIGLDTGNKLQKPKVFLSGGSLNTRPTREKESLS